MPSVLIVFTSVDKTLTGTQTGYYLPEAAHPYYVFAKTCDIDFASPKGANQCPVDEGSIKAFAEDKECVQFLADPTVKAKFASAKKIAEVDAANYDAIFYVGGHGPVIDLPFDAANAKLASDFYQAGKITASVCHGPAALVAATDAAGKSIFAGKAFTGFSNEEEAIVQAAASIPFSLEDKIVGLGGKYERAEPWVAKVVVDGNLYTGQNPASARPLAEAILKDLKK
ncbi:class I glutamine amidotransferase-like protein [Mycena floridula]|nr:class I glutamine amidotransferase-like protein [Mycena floridula]